MSRGEEVVVIDGVSKLGGTLPAPLFIFLAGGRSRWCGKVAREGNRAQHHREANDLRARKFLAWDCFFGAGIALGYPWSPWTDLLRVDVLNILGFP